MPTEVAAVPLNNGGYDGSDWDGQAVKLAQSLAVAGDVGAAVRGGVIPSVSGNLQYDFAGLNGVLSPGRVVVPSQQGGAYGAHALWFPTQTTLNHATADVSQPRTDLVIAEVQDFGGNPATVRRIRILQGTPGAAAPTPTLTTALGNGGWMPLWSVRINAGATTGTVTDLRKFTAAPGGTVWLPGIMGKSQSEQQTVSTGLALGTHWYDPTTEVEGTIGSVAGLRTLRPTTVRQIHSQTAAGPFGIVGNGNTVLGDQTVTLVGGPRLIQTTIGASIVPAGQYVQRISARIYALGDTLCSAQGRIGRAEDGERLILNATRTRILSGTQTFNLVALVEPSGSESGVARTANLTDAWITVVDLGPA